MFDKDSAKAAVYMLKGMLAEASSEEQLHVNRVGEEIRALVAQNGDAGKAALSLVFIGLYAEGGYQ